MLFFLLSNAICIRYVNKIHYFVVFEPEGHKLCANTLLAPDYLSMNTSTDQVLILCLYFMLCWYYRNMHEICMKKWLFPLHPPMQSSFICSSGKAPKCVAMLCDGHESWPSKWVACAAVYSVNICMYVKYKVYILCIGEIKWPTIFELCVIAVWSSLLFSKECILDILLLPCNTHMLYKKNSNILKQITGNVYLC